MNQLAFYLKTDRCVGCFACVSACTNENRSRTSKAFRSVRNDFDSFYLSFSCHHCSSPECMRVCLKHAFSKGRDGAVVIDDSLCDGCGKCEAVCPFQMIRIETTISGLKAKKCELCTDRRENGQEPACVEACTSGALLFGDWDEPPVAKAADWLTLDAAGVARTFTEPSTRIALPKEKKRYFL